jgi:hypothetical protein
MEHDVEPDFLEQATDSLSLQHVDVAEAEAGRPIRWAT